MTKVYSKVFEDRIQWYKENTSIFHREDGPAIECTNGNKYWYQNGKRHREDGPAIEWPDGSKEWWQNGLRHRLDGPAVEYANGSKQWYQYGKLHRTDGPAITWFNGDKEYWLNDIWYSDIKTDEEWVIFQIIN